MATPLPFRLRALTAAATFAMRRGWLPNATSVLDKPHDERLTHKAMTLACRPGVPRIRTQDVKVPGRGGPIHARVYTRADMQPGAPAILFIHGGGFIDFGLELCDSVQRGLAARTGYVVVGLSYRLAPEHPFPAGLEDCHDVLRWMAEAQLFLCPCHGGVYYADGSVSAGPPPKPLPTYPVRVRAGQVEIQTSPIPIA